MGATGLGIRALDEDGTACSADYYLRLTNDGGRMFKGQAPVTSVRPTVPMPSQGTSGVIVYEHVDYGGASGVDQDLGHAELHRALAERE